MNSYYNVAYFSELNSRFDSKYLEYQSNLKYTSEKYPIVKLGKYIEQIKNPASFKDNIEYRFYDTSINSVNENGEFVNYQIINSKNKPSRAKQVAIENTIIVANLKTNKGRACIVTNKEAGSIISTGYLIIKPKNELDINYLQMILHCKSTIYYLRQIASTGLGMANWSYDDLSKIRIALPPLIEQQKTLQLIKEKVKILEDKIKELENEKEKNSLQNITSNVIYNNYDSAKINNKDNTKYTFSLFDDMNEYLSFNNVTHKEKSEVELIPLSEIIEPGIDKKISSNNKQQLIIGLEDIDCFTGEIIDADILDNGNLNSDKVVFKGNDIMFAKMRPYLGKFIIINTENEDYIGSSELYGLKLKEGIDIKFVRLLLSSYYCINQYKQYYSGNGKPRISRNNLLKVFIPKIMIDKQQEFIDKVNEQLCEANTLGKRIVAIQSIIDKDLNKSIFEGYSEDLFKLPNGGK